MNSAEKAMQSFLESLGLDLEQEHMEKTPQRVATLFAELFSGRNQRTQDVWGEVFPTDYQGLVAVEKIPFYSMCEHHLMPFFGTVDVIYQPHEGRVAGLSKVADLVNVLARRPQLQERLSKQIAESLEQDLGAQGVLVRIQATHLCMLMKGQLELGTQVQTFEARGLLAEGGALRDQAMLILGGQGHEN